MNKQLGYIDDGIVIAVFLILFVVLGVGWVKNFISFVQCDFDAPYKAEVLRGVGIFIPIIGAIEGYIDIQDGKKSD